MVKCIFCGKEEREYKGIHLMKNDGEIAFYCSHKCRMNALKLNRDKRKVRWTEAFHIARQKSVEKKKMLDEKMHKEATGEKGEVKQKAKSKKRK